MKWDISGGVCIRCIDWTTLLDPVVNNMDNAHSAIVMPAIIANCNP